MLNDDHRKIRLFYFWTKDLVFSFKKFKKSLYLLANINLIGFSKQGPKKKIFDKEIEIIAKAKKCCILTLKVNSFFCIAIHL
jgi:hypothetical protein